MRHSFEIRALWESARRSVSEVEAGPCCIVDGRTHVSDRSPISDRSPRVPDRVWRVIRKACLARARGTPFGVQHEWLGLVLPAVVVPTIQADVVIPRVLSPPSATDLAELAGDLRAVTLPAPTVRSRYLQCATSRWRRRISTTAMLARYARFWSSIAAVETSRRSQQRRGATPRVHGEPIRAQL